MLEKGNRQIKLCVLDWWWSTRKRIYNYFARKHFCLRLNSIYNSPQKKKFKTHRTRSKAMKSKLNKAEHPKLCVHVFHSSDSQWDNAMIDTNSVDGGYQLIISMSLSLTRSFLHFYLWIDQNSLLN